MKCLVSVILLNSFVLSEPEYTGTVVRESDEVYSQETFEHFSNSSWTKRNDNLRITELPGPDQGHVLQMFPSMTGVETGSLETNVTLPGDCEDVAILYVGFKLFLSGKVAINHLNHLSAMTMISFNNLGGLVMIKWLTLPYIRLQSLFNFKPFRKPP